MHLFKWKTVENHCKDALRDGSLTHTFNYQNKILKSTQLLNRKLSKYKFKNKRPDYQTLKAKVLQEIGEDDDFVTEDSDLSDDDYTIHYANKTWDASKILSDGEYSTEVSDCEQQRVVTNNGKKDSQQYEKEKKKSDGYSIKNWLQSSQIKNKTLHSKKTEEVIATQDSILKNNVNTKAKTSTPNEFAKNARRNLTNVIDECSLATDIETYENNEINDKEIRDNHVKDSEIDFEENIVRSESIIIENDTEEIFAKALVSAQKTKSYPKIIGNENLTTKYTIIANKTVGQKTKPTLGSTEMVQKTPEKTASSSSSLKGESDKNLAAEAEIIYENGTCEISNYVSDGSDKNDSTIENKDDRNKHIIKCLKSSKAPVIQEKYKYLKEFKLLESDKKSFQSDRAENKVKGNKEKQKIQEEKQFDEAQEDMLVHSCKSGLLDNFSQEITQKTNEESKKTVSDDKIGVESDESTTYQTSEANSSSIAISDETKVSGVESSPKKRKKCKLKRKKVKKREKSIDSSSSEEKQQTSPGIGLPVPLTSNIKQGTLTNFNYNNIDHTDNSDLTESNVSSNKEINKDELNNIQKGVELSNHENENNTQCKEEKNYFTDLVEQNISHSESTEAHSEIENESNINIDEQHSSLSLKENSDTVMYAKKKLKNQKVCEKNQIEESDKAVQSSRVAYDTDQESDKQNTGIIEPMCNDEVVESSQQPKKCSKLSKKIENLLNSVSQNYLPAESNSGGSSSDSLYREANSSTANSPEKSNKIKQKNDRIVKSNSNVSISDSSNKSAVEDINGLDPAVLQEIQEPLITNACESQDIFGSQSDGETNENKDNNYINIKNAKLKENKKSFKNKIGSSRITNIPALIEEENLLERSFRPTMTLNNINDDEEIFILDVPKKLRRSDLIGKQFFYNKDTLILGNKKFNAYERNIPTVSCVFQYGKKSEFQTINIRPSGSIVAQTEMENNSKNNTPNSKKSMSVTRLIDAPSKSKRSPSRNNSRNGDLCNELYGCDLSADIVDPQIEIDLRKENIEANELLSFSENSNFSNRKSPSSRKDSNKEAIKNYADEQEVVNTNEDKNATSTVNKDKRKKRLENDIDSGISTQSEGCSKKKKKGDIDKFKTNEPDKNAKRNNAKKSKKFALKNFILNPFKKESSKLGFHKNLEKCNLVNRSPAATNDNWNVDEEILENKNNISMDNGKELKKNVVLKNRKKVEEFENKQPIFTNCENKSAESSNYQNLSLARNKDDESFDENDGNIDKSVVQKLSHCKSFDTCDGSDNDTDAKLEEPSDNGKIVKSSQVPKKKLKLKLLSNKEKLLSTNQNSTDHLNHSSNDMYVLNPLNEKYLYKLKSSPNECEVAALNLESSNCFNANSCKDDSANNHTNIIQESINMQVNAKVGGSKSPSPGKITDINSSKFEVSNKMEEDDTERTEQSLDKIKDGDDLSSEPEDENLLESSQIAVQSKKRLNLYESDSDSKDDISGTLTETGDNLKKKYEDNVSYEKQVDSRNSTKNKSPKVLKKKKDKSKKLSLGHCKDETDTIKLKNNKISRRKSYSNPVEYEENSEEFVNQYSKLISFSLPEDFKVNENVDENLMEQEKIISKSSKDEKKNNTASEDESDHEEIQESSKDHVQNLRRLDLYRSDDDSVDCFENFNIIKKDLLLTKEHLKDPIHESSNSPIISKGKSHRKRHKEKSLIDESETPIKKSKLSKKGIIEGPNLTLHSTSCENAQNRTKNKNKMVAPKSDTCKKIKAEKTKKKASSPVKKEIVNKVERKDNENIINKQKDLSSSVLLKKKSKKNKKQYSSSSDCESLNSRSLNQGTSAFYVRSKSDKNKTKISSPSHPSKPQKTGKHKIINFEE